jgi:hypothetical protein
VVFRLILHFDTLGDGGGATVSRFAARSILLHNRLLIVQLFLSAYLLAQSEVNCHHLVSVF